MLNVSAKEFVPAASPARGGAATSAPPKPKTEATAAAEAEAADCAVGCIATVVTSDAVVKSQLQPSPKAQLSPKAPAFVPRAAAAVSPAAGCNKNNHLDAVSDPHRSVLDPPRSDSTVSSSVVSREADGCWGYGEGCGDEQPEPSALDDGAAGGGYYYPCAGAGAGELGGFDGYGFDATVEAAQGGELVPEEMLYDTYSYGGCYNGYVMPYTADCGGAVDPLGATVYYDTAAAAADYDISYTGQQPQQQQQQAVYYWDEATGSYVYGGDAAQYDATQYDNTWQQQQYDGGVDGAATFQQLPAAAAADSEVSLEDGIAAAAAGDGAAADLLLDVEQVRSLARSDAAELLEMFFPHYAGGALAKLLDRTGGDLLAAFSELAAMERQMRVEGAMERAGGGKGARGGGGGRGNGGGGRSPGKAPAGGGGGKRSSGGGGGATAFKLDLEAFPSLPPSASPQPVKPAPQPSPSASPQAPAAPTLEAAEPQADSCAGPAAADATSSTATTAHDDDAPATTTGPAPSSVPAAAGPTAKPNFAALLRNSASAASSSSSPSPSDLQQRSASQPQPQPQRDADATGPSSSSRPARAARCASAVPVPWVSTGEAVAAQYAEERAEASLLAKARNTYFQQATLAYLSGDKALAKQLGRKGREANEAMKAAHAAAARRIFAARNAGHQQQNGHASSSRSRNARPSTGGGRAQQQQGQGQSGRQQQQQTHGQGGQGGEALFVDLHGLHAAEAVAVLEGQIEAARAAGCRFLRVCTGTGHHTKGAKTPARLPAAVADTLLSNHLTFKTLQPGLLEARL